MKARKRRTKAKPQKILRLLISRKLDEALRAEAARRGVSRVQLVRQVLHDNVRQLQLPFEADS